MEILFVLQEHASTIHSDLVRQNKKIAMNSPALGTRSNKKSVEKSTL